MTKRLFSTDAPDVPEPRARALPTSRLGRLFRLGALAPKALPIAMEGARRALSPQRDRTEEDERVAQARLLEDAKKAAYALLNTLGEMKGLPLKLGQMVSYIDGLAPPGYEERVQSVLKKLQQKAPPLDPAAAVRVVREELGALPTEVFAGWESMPFAAASIGQVHRARTRGGDAVAVKVQYPGVDKAIENDLKSLSLLEQFAAPLGRRYHTKESLEEIRSVFMSELDYTREAQMADLFRKMNADLPEVVIPRVYHALTTKRVLTEELMGGETYQEFCARASQEERNAAGVTIWKFMFRSLLRYGVLYADPHPGNYRFLGGGNVAFLDFGCIKVLPSELVRGIKRYMRAAMDADWKEFDRACVEVLGYNQENKPEWDLFRSYTIELLLPVTSHAPFQCSQEGARETIAYLVRGARKLIWKDGKEALPHVPQPIDMPADFTFVNRLQWGLASILGGLHTEARFRDLTEPWVRDNEWPLPD